MENPELIKKNIHMDCIRAEAVTQITPQDDRNIPDSKPDAERISLSRAEACVDEIKAQENSVCIKGRICYHLLYYTSEPGCPLAPFEGEIPFEDKMNLTGVTSSDTVTVTAEIEDFSASLINSRKLSLRALVTLHACVEELCDEQVPVGLQITGTKETDGMSVQYCQNPMQLTQVAVCRSDVFRIREETAIPTGLPNVRQLLWTAADLRDVSFRVTEDKIGIQGECGIFILYEGEGEEHPIHSYETTLPFSGSLECSGCREGMLSDIRYRIAQSAVTVRPDPDGEERTIALELTMDIRIRVYEEEQVRVLSDIYGTTSRIDVHTHTAKLPCAQARISGRTRVSDTVRIPGGEPVLHVLYSQAQADPVTQTITDDGLRLTGSIAVQILYITEKDEEPYVGMETRIPYQYLLEVPDIRPDDMARVSVRTEQLQVTMTDSEELEVKVLVCAEAMVFRCAEAELIDALEMSEFSPGTVSELPGMVIRFVRRGESLWELGKQYYVPVEKLKALNGLEDDTLEEGQKLLIAR